MQRQTRSFIFISVLLLLFSSKSLFADGIRVAVASNFLQPAKYIASVYQHETGEKVLISAGSTGKLYAQIINGAPFDIFLAANQREPKRLEDEGYVVAGSRFTYARGKLALWDAKGLYQNKTIQEVLESSSYRRLSIANPSIAPYGNAALSILKNLKFDDVINNKLITGENVSQAYQYVATGAADIGFVALSQLKSYKDKPPGKYWLVDEALYEPILQQAVLLKNTKNKLKARNFLNYLKGSKAMAMIENFGYGLI